MCTQAIVRGQLWLNKTKATIKKRLLILPFRYHPAVQDLQKKIDGKLESKIEN